MIGELAKILKSLHSAAIDAGNGYEEALKDAQGRGLTPLFQEMMALHRKHSQEIAASLRSQGEKGDEDASFMTTVNRTIMSIRSLFGGLEASVVPGLIDGEERNVAHYDDALTRDFPLATHEMLARQRSDIESAIIRLRAMHR